LPKNEAPKATSANVINLMDALRKSVAADPKVKKPVASEKDARKGIGLVKTPG
jgi:non-homologous end joining protein Ku